MKVVNVPYTFYPDPVGGTEIITLSFAKHMAPLGVETVIAAPGRRDQTYLYEGVLVRRFEFNPDIPLNELYGEGDTVGAASFARVLDEQRPDIVHFQGIWPGASVLALREARKRNIATLLTYQTPAVSCQRGTLMRWGRDVCDGKQRLHLCSQCALQGLGVPLPAAYLLGAMPSGVSAIFEAAHRKGSVWTALSMVRLMKYRHDAFQKFVSEVDGIVVVAEWIKTVLLNNGVSADKISVRRLGIDRPIARAAAVNDENKDVLKLIFLGRLTPDKGLDVLIRAIRLLPDEKILLDAFIIVQPEQSGFYEKLKVLATGDARIRFHEALPNNEVVSCLKNYDFLVIPSQWLESAPVVIIEAFAAGIPVIGTRRGGIPELVFHGKNGVLVDGGAPSWREALKSLCDDGELKRKLKAGVTPPKTVQAAASEIKELYSLLKKN